ncbi:benzaldehyde dehydrogenase (NAD) [Pseudomonas duriflava]|uniref:Benzaldehyde dehydrogenase (NAD) n=1 Tax=Pseudomonas duriflava TaxID=459528 RepID=A0A562PLA9_9PSED|nr:benzaldehyde dehydrogenase (NAD) [Pseudomonas duriflava]
MSTTESMLPVELWNERLFTGDWQAGHLPPTPVIEPASGATLGQIANADGSLVNTSSKTASMAKPLWFAQPYETRSLILRKAAQAAEPHFDEIVSWIVKESGSTRAKAAFETTLSIKALYESAGLPSRSQGEVLPSVPGRLSLARRRPLGVIGVISPFNFPLYLAIRAVAPALAVGNAVVLKPDPRTAVCGGFVIVELAGLPKGLLHVLPGGLKPVQR